MTAGFFIRDTEDRAQLVSRYQQALAVVPRILTSYSNPLGSGNRTASITVTMDATIQGTASLLVDGNTATNATFFNNSNDVSGIFFKFQLSSAKVIDEAKFYQSTSDSHGTWKWQGSNDNSAWTDIGSSFTLGGTGTQTQTSMNGNQTAWLYYRLLGVTGARSSTPNHYEFEFKVSA